MTQPLSIYSPRVLDTSDTELIINLRVLKQETCERDLGRKQQETSLKATAAANPARWTCLINRMRKCHDNPSPIVLVSQVDSRSLCMKWRQFWPEYFLAAVVIALEAPQWSSETRAASTLNDVGWTSQRKLAARSVAVK